LIAKHGGQDSTSRFKDNTSESVSSDASSELEHIRLRRNPENDKGEDRRDDSSERSDRDPCDARLRQPLERSLSG
jgi:hypothetical protein